MCMEEEWVHLERGGEAGASMSQIYMKSNALVELIFCLFQDKISLC